MAERVITNKVEFEELMIEIDSILVEKDISIHAREIHALSEAGRLLDTEVTIAPIGSAPIPGVYEGESLLAHIVKWVRDHYGGRLNVDFSIGHSLILIRGTPWLLRFPLMIGNVRVICERDLSKKFQNFVTHRSGEPHEKPMINLLLCIEDLPQVLASELSDDELREILDYFLFGLDFFLSIQESFREVSLVMSGLRDLKCSAKCCVDNNSMFGLSRWASLQAAEKFPKFYIEQKGEQYPHTHDLSKLSEQAHRLGLPIINESALKHLQCSETILYETPQQSTVDVVNAHQDALKVGALVLQTLTESKKS